MTSDSITFRPGQPGDVDACGRILFDAFGAVSARHGFPPDFPKREMAAGVAAMALSYPGIYSVVAERDGAVVGSNFLWELGVVAGVGPITVDPAAQGLDVGRRLMENVLNRARDRQFASVRLVQAAFNSTSMSLYTKLGFDVREPLICLNGPPPAVRVDGFEVRDAADADVPACNALCFDIHGHDREPELRAAIARGNAAVAIHAGNIAGYVTDLGFFGHAAARSNTALIALIGAAKRIADPGFLLPTRNGEVFRWCLDHGLRVTQPLTLMSMGLYNEPRGAFLPSILF